MSNLLRHKPTTTALLVASLAGVLIPAFALAQDCVAIGGCGGDVPSGMCGTSIEPIETGSGCNGLLNCQDPEILSESPEFEVEPLPVTADGPPKFRVRMAFGVRSPWNLWARENNPNGQLQGRWLDSGNRVSVCNSNLADESKIWVEKTMTCAEMISSRNPDGGNTSAEKYSLVVASCGPPCNPEEPGCFSNSCHRWEEKKDVPFSIPDDQLEEFCPPKRCPEGSCCLPGPQGAGPPGFGFGGAGGRGAGGRGGPPAPGVRAPAVKIGPNPTLGRFWSHTFAETIIPRSGPDHVWLFTAAGVYHEFWDLDGNGTFDKVSPSDVHDVLRKVGSNWELRSLNGTVREYGADGRWTLTRDRNGNETVGVYADGVLERVDLPDGRAIAFTYHGDGLLASATEVGVDGVTSRTWSYTWDGEDLSRIDRPDGTAWLLRYDDPANPGYLTRITLRGTDGGERVEEAREYDVYGNLIRQWRGDTSPTGPNAIELTTTSYPDPWNPTERYETDALGNLTITTYLRDPDSNVPLVTTTSGGCSSCGTDPNTQQLYDDPSNPMKVTRLIDARGTVTLFEYDEHGQRTSRTEAFMTDLERTTTWEYHDVYPSLVTAIERPSTSGSGVRRTSWAYDEAGNAITRTEEGVENGEAFSYTTIMTYNLAGQVQSIDPPGHGTEDKISFSYDSARGSLIRTTRTDPLIGATSFGYDTFNRNTLVTDVRGQTTSTAYDLLDRVRQVSLESNEVGGSLVKTYFYTPHGDLSLTILPKGNVVAYSYDEAGRLIAVERKPDTATPGERILTTLDDIGQTIREDLQIWSGTSWTSETFTEYLYSNSCFLEKIVKADGSTTEYASDCTGSEEREWDANHPSDNQQRPATKLYRYDRLRRLASVTMPWGGDGDGSVVITYEHDTQDHLVKIVDGNGSVTQFVYSDRDLLTEEQSEVSGATTFSYNESGNMVRKIDPLGNPVDRFYDPLKRLTLIDYKEDSLDTFFTYDNSATPFAKGRLTEITRAGESIRYQYDRFGRLIQDGSLTYEYDKNGNRRTVGYPGGVTAVYTHDFADREVTLTLDDGNGSTYDLVANASYLPSGPLDSLALGNGLVEVRLFDQQYRPKLIQVAGLLEWSYAVDSMGNITGIADASSPDMGRAFGWQDYQYYLTSGEGPWGIRSWTYDRMGNRLDETRDGAVSEYSYLPNATGKNSALLTSVSKGGDDEFVYYSYDAAGNLTHKKTEGAKTRFRYDFAGRLTNVRTERPPEIPALIDMRYDGRGFLAVSRLRLAHDSFQVRSETEPTYSSDGVLYHRVARRFPGVLAPRGDLVSVSDDFIFYFGQRPVAQLSRRSVTSEGGPTDTDSILTFFTTDHLDTTILATDADGQVVWAGGLGPFGEDFADAEGADLPLRFPGQWVDETWQEPALEEDLHYNVYRWYLRSVGAYNRVDPLGIIRSVGIAHPLTYANSRPLMVTDPLGLDAITSDPLIQRCFFCLFKKAGFGRYDHEEGTWIFKDDNEMLDCKWELSSRETRQTGFRRVNMPTGTVAIAHTHPTNSEAEPIKDDPDAARTASRWAGRNTPIYTIHRDGIFKFDPQTGMITQEEPAGWWDKVKKECEAEGGKPCKAFKKRKRR